MLILVALVLRVAKISSASPLEIAIVVLICCGGIVSLLFQVRNYIAQQYSSVPKHM